MGLDEDIVRLVRNGLTLGVKQDWEEYLLRENTFVENLLEKTKAGGVVSRMIKDLRQRQTTFLFKSWVPV